MAADREAQRQRDADAAYRANEETNRAQAAANARDRQRAQAARTKQARNQKSRPSKQAPRPAASSATSEPGSMAGFFGFSGAVASALYAGTRAWREQSGFEFAGRSDAPFMEAVKGAIEVGGPEIWIPTAIAAALGGSLLYHLSKPLLVLTGLGAAAFVYAHGKKEGWF